MNGKASSNRILGYSFLASVLINMGWVAWIAHSSIFGSAVTMTTLHERPIRIFKPVPVKPRPKPKTVTPLPPPPPPKQAKAPPEIKPLRQVLHLRAISHMPPSPHKQTVRPAPMVSQAQTAPATTPVAARPVSLPRPIAVAQSPRSMSSLLRTPSPENIGPVQPTAPSPTPQTTQAPAVRQPEPTVKQPEPVAKRPEPAVKQSEPTPVVRHASEVRAQPEAEPPRRVEHPKGWVNIEAREATLEGDIEVPPLPDGVELGQLESTTVIISYEVDESGHPTNVKVRKRSGNSELDEKCIEAVRRARYLPAVQDHIPYAARTSFSFNFT